MTLRFGPEFFLDKEPSEETVKAAVDAKARGYVIAYPAPFLQKLNPNFQNQATSKVEDPANTVADKNVSKLK